MRRSLQQREHDVAPKSFGVVEEKIRHGLNFVDHGVWDDYTALTFAAGSRLI